MDRAPKEPQISSNGYSAEDQIKTKPRANSGSHHRRQPSKYAHEWAQTRDEAGYSELMKKKGVEERGGGQINGNMNSYSYS